MSESLSRITFTSPEVAQVGLTERTAREQYSQSELQVMTNDITKIDRAVNEDDRVGLIKIIALRDGRILGAVIVGERAGETITELAVAIGNPQARPSSRNNSSLSHVLLRRAVFGYKNGDGAGVFKEVWKNHSRHLKIMALILARGLRRVSARAQKRRKGIGGVTLESA